MRRLIITSDSAGNWPWTVWLDRANDTDHAQIEAGYAALTKALPAFACCPRQTFLATLASVYLEWRTGAAPRAENSAGRPRSRPTAGPDIGPPATNPGRARGSPVPREEAVATSLGPCPGPWAHGGRLGLAVRAAGPSFQALSSESDPSQ